MILLRFFIFLVLISLVSCSSISFDTSVTRDPASLAVIAKGCRGLLHDFLTKTKKIEFDDLKFPSEELKQRYITFFKELNPEEANRYREFSNTFFKQIDSHKDPYSIMYSLREIDGIESSEQVFAKMLELHELLIKRGSDGSINAEKLNAWIDSDIQALIVYDTLARTDLVKNKPIMDFLFENNAHFLYVKRNRGPPGSAITYSFEKESSNIDITMLFKDPKMSDDEWLELPEEVRLDFLKESTEFQQLIKNKDFLPSEKVAPTELKPYFMSGYSRELEKYFGKKGYSWEVANKMYEISVDRIITQLKEVKQITKETHSIHAHVVFEMSKDYKYFKKFNTWVKATNDYFYFKCLEEGMHASELVNIANLPSGKFNWRDLLPGAHKTELPATLEKIDRRSGKYFSMAVRGEIYGPGSTPQLKKVGLELRDTTRKLEVLEDHMERVSDSVSKYVWENLADAKNYDDAFKIDTSLENTLRLTKGILDEKTATEFHKFEPTFVLAFVKYEQELIMDFNKGKTFKIGSEAHDTIIEARKAYIDELKLFVEELAGYSSKNEVVEDEIKQMAVRMIIAGWAKKVKLSQYLQNI